jgi:HD-GYP domain-containing protein (c-di-GMP phosphodiesterase class II)
MSSNFSFTEKVVNSDQVPITTKMKYINTLSDSVVEDLFRFGVGADSIENIKKIGSFVLSTVKEIDCLADIMKQLDSLPNEMSKHAMATAYFSLMIADEMHITLKAALEKLVLGSLVHDIGLREIPREILTKPRLQWTEEELHYYESHPSRGVEILKGIPQISYDILLIVNEHHENALGLGFPRRIRDIKINPLARIVAIADYVTDMMYDQPANKNAKDLDSIIDYIQNVMGQPFNKPAFFALKSLANKQNRINKFK